MDGAPVKGESIPIRVFLAGYDLTPTMRDINKKFSVKYYLNLVLVDEEERRYFKQQVSFYNYVHINWVIADLIYNLLRWIFYVKYTKELQNILFSQEITLWRKSDRPRKIMHGGTTYPPGVMHGAYQVMLNNLLHFNWHGWYILIILSNGLIEVHNISQENKKSIYYITKISLF